MKTKFGWIDALSIVLFILAVYLILTRIFGHPATDLAISVSLFSIIYTFIYKLNREFGEFKAKTVHGSDKVKDDINTINRNIKEIKGNVNDIGSDIREIKQRLKI